MTIPDRGTPKDQLFTQMERLRAGDGDAKGHRLFSLVYGARPDVLEVAEEAYRRFFSENGLNPMTFPSLRRFESDVLATTLSLLSAPAGAAGSMTSGGSESLLLAVKTARDWARVHRPGVRSPSMLLPVTAHPALHKAAHALDVRAVTVPVTTAFTADVEAARELADDDTILVVASAPQYPHGVLDPVAPLAELAAERGILCHVDACIGGFFLPWLEKLGTRLPPFDFRVPGVTSISADLHKYGYAAKGASTILYRTAALRRHQHFAYADWPGGLFVSPSMLGTRPGGAIAAAWAVMNYLGAEGYLDLTRRAMDATARIRREVESIAGLVVLGDPVMSILAVGAAPETVPLDLYVVADAMQERGWRIDRQQSPASLHFTVSPEHDAVVAHLVRDLRETTEAVRASGKTAEGMAAMYGMLGRLPDRAVVREALLDFMDGMDGSAS